MIDARNVKHNLDTEFCQTQSRERDIPSKKKRFVEQLIMETVSQLAKHSVLFRLEVASTRVHSSTR